MSVVKLTCSFCKNEFYRERKNIKKSAVKNYCTRLCKKSQEQIDYSDEYTLVRHPYTKAKCRAKADNIYFDLSIEYVLALWEKQKGICALTGDQLVFGNTQHDKQHGFSTASLDRIDSHGSYVEGNVQWIHKIIQKMKFDLNEQVFIHWCGRVTTWMDAEKGFDGTPGTPYNEVDVENNPPF